MPEYPFESPTGQIVHRVYSMASVPSIGDTIDIDGVPHRRVASDFVVDGNPLSSRYPVESLTLSRAIPLSDAPKRGYRGRVIIESRDHEKRLCEKYGYVAD